MQALTEESNPYIIVASGAPFWASICGVVSATLVLALLHYNLYHRSGWRILHFVSCIASAIGLCLFIIFDSISIKDGEHTLNYGLPPFGPYWDGPGDLSSLIVLMGSTLAISSANRKFVLLAGSLGHPMRTPLRYRR